MYLILLLATVLGALGIWLMLPRGHTRGRMAGLVLAAAGLGLFGSQLPGLGDWLSRGVFYVMAGVTVAAAAATVVFRNPVYSAIWFGLTLAGTAGLFLFQGAQFLAVATVVVYAGAILVTFLFVLMLAEPSGRARYDRVGWEAFVSACCGAVLVGVLTTTVAGVLVSSRFAPPPQVVNADRDTGVLYQQQMVRLGEGLFDRYLIAVEVAGVLLLAALVGAAVIVGHSRGPLVGSDTGPATGPRRGLLEMGEGGNGHA